MNRVIQPGDFVSVDGMLYEITEISDRIELSLLTNPSVKDVVLPIEGKWKFGGTNENVLFIARESLNPLFTGIFDTDVIILTYLDDATLAAVCQVNRYARTLCQDETLWMIRTQRNYPDYLYGREIGETWQNFYQILKEVIDKDGWIDIYKLVDYKRYKLLEQNQDDIDIDVANYAAMIGQLNVLKWLAGLPSAVLPGQEGADEAAGNGHLDVLEWLAGLPSAVLPEQWGANMAAANGHLDVLEWLAGLPSAVLPDQWGANGAARNGHLNVLKWLAGLPSAVLPDQLGANMAAANGHLDVLEWLAGLPKIVLPGRRGANLAAENGRLDVLKWLAGLPMAVLPDQKGANEAARNGHLDVLKWLAGLPRAVLPDQEGANEAVRYGQLDVLKWLAEPPRMIFPSK